MNKKVSGGAEEKQPLVSVLVPIYNVEKYLRQCLESLKNQTLKNIEFICINDGSTDNSKAIINEYIKLDKRFKLLDKENSGYGDSMNQGLKKAKGKYIGIVESDDWAEPNMFDDLSRLAEENNADAVKSNFFFHNSTSGYSDYKMSLIDPHEVGSIIVPRESTYIFGRMATIWSGLYRRDFLNNNKINFVPSPGASFQDTGFNFKVWSVADRAVYTSNAYLHYRIDNDQSSVKSKGKVYCICDELASIKEFLLKNNLMEQLKSSYTLTKISTYLWNIDRLDNNIGKDFIYRMSKELHDDIERGYFDPSRLSNHDKSQVQKIIDNPGYYINKRAAIRILSKGYRFIGHIYSKINRSQVKRLQAISNIESSIEQLDKNIDLLEKSFLKNPWKYTESQHYDDNNPEISIIVPVYNVEKYIKRTLESLTSQTFKNIEIVCVNDGSKDKSLEIMQEVAKKDQRIKIINQDNSGVATARNTGLKNASGKFIMFCDSDDTYSPDMCLKMVNAVNRRGVDIAMCGTNVVVDDIGKKLRKDTVEYLRHKFKGGQVLNWYMMLDTDVSLLNKIFHSDIIKNHKLGFPDGLKFEDAYFNNIYMLASKTIYYFDDKLYTYYRRPGSIMSNSFKKDSSSADYLKITVVTYDYMKKHGLFDTYVEFFARRLIQDFSYSRDNQSKDGAEMSKKFLLKFIREHQKDYNKIPKGYRSAISKEMSSHGYKYKLKTKLLNIRMKILKKISRRYRQQLKLLQLSNRLIGQCVYQDYLIEKRSK